MRGRLAYPNPYRRVAGVETKTWLPEDAGMFTDPTANVSLSGSNVMLPDGRKVSVKFIGKGNWTQAYKGKDGWVYLFSKHDPAKELLVQVAKNTVGEPFSIHLPWIERIGSAADGYAVYRMPFYKPLDSRNKKIAKQLRAIEDDVREDAWVYSYDVAERIAEGVKSLGNSDPVRFGLISKAVRHLEDAMDRAGWDYNANFEFPMANLAQDVEGNFVLLDVIYRSEAEPKGQASPWKPGAGGIDADFGD